MMERRCSVLTCVTLIYSLFVFIKNESLTSITGFSFEILIFQCLFVLLFNNNKDTLKDQSKYRPHVASNLMSLFLVPLCLISDVLKMQSKQDSDSFTRFHDIELNLGITAVCITKYFFSLGKNKLAALAMLIATVGYILVFANFNTIVIFILFSFLVWKSMEWIPKVAPQSFSFAEMCMCLQLGFFFSARIIREIIKMQPIHLDELRLKWIGAAAVVAILIATTIIWLMKVFLSVFSGLTFVGVYVVFAVFSLGFLTWISQANLLWWFLHLMEGNCTLKMLLLSWALFCGITVLWTVGHGLQISVTERKRKLSNDTQYTSEERQDTGEDTFEGYRRRKNVGRSEDDAEQDCYVETKEYKVDGSPFDKRKVFHLFILLVYIPGLLIAPHILFLAACLAFGIFIIVEAARVLEVPRIGLHLDKILRIFVDERDGGILFLTHFYLLVGLSLPLWITNSSLTTVAPLKLYSGVLSLGIGDTVACIAGKAFGRHRWNGTKKTVEGTLSSIVAQLIFIYICSYCDLLPFYSHAGVMLGVVHSGLYEAFTDQIDNLVLPLALYPFLCLT